MIESKTNPAHILRTLYFTRSAVQLSWAAALFTLAEHPSSTAVLLVLYPLWDVACTIYDLSTSQADAKAIASQRVNAALGVITAIAIALTAWQTPAYAVVAFGAWALIAGILQLVAGVQRRKALGGQWAMILSGAQSTLAGGAFIAGGLSGKMHARDLGGYAIFGAVYFLIAGLLLLRRKA